MELSRCLLPLAVICLLCACVMTADLREREWDFGGQGLQDDAPARVKRSSYGYPSNYYRGYSYQRYGYPSYSHRSYNNYYPSYQRSYGSYGRSYGGYGRNYGTYGYRNSYGYH
nr:hypothetical protein BaRGS_020811 [Batillaria attramentaria]